MWSASRILTVQRLDCPVTAYDWPFARADRARIAAHWAGLVRDRPALYNGRVLLARDCQIIESAGARILSGTAFEADFASFLAWRDFGFPDPHVRNWFSMAAVLSADGAWMLGVMNDHTSNAGQIYFPAGTPDVGDICEGQIDFGGSAVRELREETGLDAADMETDAEWSVILQGPRIGCMKIFRAREAAASLAGRIEAFLATQRSPELKGVHIVRTRADLAPTRMPDFIIAWLEEKLP